jgi:hypothetical protein
MNERVEELAHQAGLDSFYVPEWSPWAEEFEKFAELIVRECARIARATPCPYEEDEVRQRLGHTWDMASLEAGREIVKHFGVEE